MFYESVFYESNQIASERAEGGRRRTLPLHVSPVNLNAHVVVAPGIPGMRIGVAPMLTSLVPFIPISCTRLLQVVAGIRHHKFLRGVGEGKDHNIFYTHQQFVELVILVSAILSVKILNV